MKFNPIPFSISVFLFIAVLGTGYGTGLAPNYILEEDSLLAPSNLARSLNIPEDTIQSILDSSFFHKTFLPFYMEEAISKMTAFPEDFVKNVKNEECKGNVLRLIDLLFPLNITDLGKNHLWALHMVDAWAKPPEGILSGHINAMGDYDECVGIRAVETLHRINFAGKYCTVHIYPKPEKPKSMMSNGISLAGNLKHQNDSMSIQATTPEELLELMGILVGVIMLPSIGVCFPDTCPDSDIETMLLNGLELLNIPPAMAAPTMYQCYVEKKPDLDAGDITMISILGVLAFTCLFTGILDIYMNRGLEKPPKRGLGMQYLMAFSFYTNVRKWQTVGPGGGDDLGCVHGIRFLSTCWVILAHTWYMVTFIPVWNMVDLKKVQEDWPVLLIINSTVSVDTFFVLSGMLVCYAVMKTLEKQKGSLNIPMFYVHRYLRLTPTYALLVGIMATIFPYLGSGPFWRIMDRWSNICENNWWTNMLYVNNFVNTSFLCQGEAWYLANDFQFYVVSPFLIYPLYRWTTIGLIILALTTIGSILCPGLLVQQFNIVPTTIGTREIQKWFLDVYIKPWARIQTYLVGIALGYLLHKTRGKKVNIPVLVQIAGWTISTGTCLAVLFGIYPYFDPNTEIPRTEAFFFAALNRFGWGVSIAWVIFACVKGYGGIINQFLSWSAFVPLGRLCFCAFLVSLHLQMILHLSFRQALTFEPYTMVNFFFAHLIMSFLVAFFCTIMMESPFIIISKLLLEGGGRGSGGGRPALNGVAKPGPVERYGIFYNNGDTVINTDRPGEIKNEKERA